MSEHGNVEDNGYNEVHVHELVQLRTLSSQGSTTDDEDSEDRRELQQGENWLRLVRKGGESVLDFTQETAHEGHDDETYELIVVSLEALGTIEAPSDDCFLCIDVDHDNVAIKDMRLPSSKNSSDSDESGDDSDDNVAGISRGVCGEWEKLPRRQMRRLVQDDRVCTSVVASGTEDFRAAGPILIYRKRKETDKVDDTAVYSKTGSPIGNQSAIPGTMKLDTPGSDSIDTQPDDGARVEFRRNATSQREAELATKMESDEVLDDEQKDGLFDNGKGDADSDKTLLLPPTTQPEDSLSDDETSIVGDFKMDVGDEMASTNKEEQKPPQNEKEDGQACASDAVTSHSDRKEQLNGEEKLQEEPQSDIESSLDDKKKNLCQDFERAKEGPDDSEKESGEDAKQNKSQGTESVQCIYSQTLLDATQDPPVEAGSQLSIPLLSQVLAKSEDTCSESEAKQSSKTGKEDGERNNEAMIDNEETRKCNEAMANDTSGALAKSQPSNEKRASTTMENKANDDGTETNISEPRLSPTDADPTSSNGGQKPEDHSDGRASRPAARDNNETFCSDDAAVSDRRDENGEENKPSASNSASDTTNDWSSKNLARPGMNEDPKGSSELSPSLDEQELPNQSKSRKRRVESSSETIIATPETKRSRTSEQDTKESSSKTRKTSAVDQIPERRSARKTNKQESIHSPPPAAKEGSAAKERRQIRVMTTGVQLSLSQKQKLKKLGGTLVENIEDATSATHIIASDGKSAFKRTPKLMIGLCTTSNIVRLEWLTKSLKSNDFVNTNHFLLLNDKAAEKTYGISMRETLNRANEMRSKGESLLGGFSVHVCPGVAGNKSSDNRTPPAEEFRLIIEAAGGTWVPSIPTKGVDFPKLVLITSKIEKEAKRQLSAKPCSKAKKSGAKSLSTDKLFQSIMSQELNLD